MTRRKFILSNLKGYRIRYSISLIGACANGFFSVIPTVILGDIVDNIIYQKTGLEGEERIRMLWIYVAMFISVAMAGILLRMFYRLITYKSASHVEMNLRSRLYAKLQTLDHSFYTHNTSGEIISQMTSDAAVIRNFFASVLYNMASDISNLTFVFITLIAKSGILAALIAMFIPFIAVSSTVLHQKTKMLHKNLRDKFSDMNNYVNENLAANRVVKAFAREDYENERLEKISREYRDMSIGNTKKRLIYSMPIHLTAEVMRVFTLIACGYMIIRLPQSGLTVGALTVFTSLVFTIVARVRDFSGEISAVQQYLVSANKVTKLYNTEPEIDSIENIKPDDGKIHKIEFRHVSLVLDGQTIIDNVSFKVYEGQTLAIVGPTGAGKTILISMLLRLYDPTDGEILINNVDIRYYSLERLRKMIALSTQDVFLFSDTIDSNIKYSNPDLPFDVVKSSAECAQAAEFIEKLTEGYQTIIGERGVGLSGGQRQRIALARAVAKKSSLIILDDTTSAVDMETEVLIIKELSQITNKIKIIVAQRISSVVSADKILVIENGKITEQGTHEELVENGGYYTSIYNISQKGSTEVVF